MIADFVIYTLRPNNTALWLPSKLAASLGIHRGDKLTPAQFASAEIQRLLADRMAAEKGARLNL